MTTSASANDQGLFIVFMICANTTEHVALFLYEQGVL